MTKATTGPPVDLKTPSSTPGETVEIPAADGFPLAGSLYLPALGPPQRLIIVNAATGVPRRFYGRYSRHLAELGQAVLTYDYRGVAGSRPPDLRGFDAHLSHWVEDLGTVRQWARNRFPDLPVVLLGHSIGGVVALFSPPVSPLERIVTLGAQVSYWKDWSLAHRYQRFALWHLFFPVLTGLAGYFPGRRFGFGEDLPKGFATDWANCWRGPKRLEENLPLHRLANLTCPVVAVGVHDDTIATAPALERLHRLLPPEILRYHWIAPQDHGLERLGHFDAFRKLGAPSVWKDLDEQLLGGGSPGRHGARFDSQGER